MQIDDPFLILFVHGSKDPRWRKPFEQFTADIENHLGKGRVGLAYMEFVSPTLIEVIQRQVQKGTRSFVLVPLFMAGGAHIAKDLPEQVAQAEKDFPGISIDIKRPVGEHPEVIHAMEKVTLNYLA